MHKAISRDNRVRLRLLFIRLGVIRIMKQNSISPFDEECLLSISSFREFRRQQKLPPTDRALTMNSARVCLALSKFVRQVPAIGIIGD